jgi:signal transduction histidine kinase
MIHSGSHLRVFRSLRNKLLALMIALSLLPLIGISVFSYNAGSKQIAEDRIKLLLESKAQDTADKIDIMLRNQKQEVGSMAAIFWRAFPDFGRQRQDRMIQMLNDFCLSYEVYDILLVVDNQGKIAAINSVNRYGQPIDSAKYLGQPISMYAEEYEIFKRSARGESSHHDWYRSQIVQKLYDNANEDISHQYNISYAEPLLKPATHESIGAWISIINWACVQDILDSVEPDLANQDLKSGYAFMYAKDADTIIAHKYRANRRNVGTLRSNAATEQNLYATSLITDHGLKNLYDAILAHDRSNFYFDYEFPKGTRKISGFASIDPSFGWIVGVGVDEIDIFRPIKRLSWWIVAATCMLGVLVIASTFLIAQGITVPLKNLIHSAQTIAQGNLSQRVQIQSSDEIGILGSTFNDMARALEGRETELQELNRNLENIVRQRTQELESSHEALKKAYLDLQNTQEQLVHTEKMASLGQLVAGIAHEIKNPLNFIYGNTGFLAEYTSKLQALLEEYDRLPSLSPDDRRRIAEMKECCNYDFIREDLPTLIGNFSEGAGRINTIVSDLRTFSRMDSYSMSETDVHAAIEISLNLLRNQYKEKIEIHREYGRIPKIQGFAGKLSQVFMNLLTNAFHAIGEKGDIWIRTRLEGDMVDVEIQDNGHGIPRENLKRIFEPFFTTKAVGQGTGLGLSISYGIVEQHHGKIAVANAPGGGTIFTVRLPIFQEKSVS